MRLKQLLYVILLFTVVTRTYALLNTHGMAHPDSLYQYIEPVHRLIYGYGLVPWEFSAGIRSWLYPGMNYAVFRTAALFGFGNIGEMIFAVRFVHALISVAAVYAIYLLTKEIYDERTGVIAAFFAASSGVLFLWTARIMPEAPSMLLMCLSFLLMYRGTVKDAGRDGLLSGILLGLSFMVKFTSAVVLLPMAAFAVLERRHGVLKHFLLGFAVVMAFQGFLDLLTWGSFLHSPVGFIIENVLKGKSSMFGVEPPYYYILPLALHIPLFFFLPWTFEKNRGTIYLYLNFLSYMIILSILPHKEMRFVFAVLPLFFAISARGLDNYLSLVMGILGGKRGPMAVAGSFIFFILIAQLVIFFELPEYWGGGWTPLYDNLQAMAYVGSQEDSTGVAYTMHWYVSGVYTYLHRDMPAYHVLDISFNSSDYLSDGYVIPHEGFYYGHLEEIMNDENINYLVTNEKDLPKVEITLEEHNFERVKTWGNVSVHKRMG